MELVQLSVTMVMASEAVVRLSSDGGQRAVSAFRTNPLPVCTAVADSRKSSPILSWKHILIVKSKRLF